jgi:crotonobetainyl-CoA:carnitine CoA-transferase CaiB-like acyl-CoA transferase
MSKALGDVVVLDLPTTFWGSVGGALLGDFGAQVIHLETLPEVLESRSEELDPEAPWDYRAELANRNKLSLAVDLATGPGAEIVKALVSKADVFITDRPHSFLQQGGWDYASLTALKPDLIYGWASGFGPEGPDRDLPALDELAAARTGMMPILPQPGEPPVYADAGQMYTAVMLAFGVTLALHHREETGEGQEVDVSLLAGNMYGASLDVQAFLAMGGERFLHPVSRLDGGNPMSGIVYPSKDGLWVCLTMPDTDRWWPGLAEIVGLDPDDPRFNSHEKRTEDNRLELIQYFEQVFPQQPASHWRAALEERGLSADIIEEFDYPTRDMQVLRNRYILELDRPGVGRIKTLGFPIFMSESPGRLSRAAPSLGQHSAEILHDMLGYSEDRIGELEANGIIA